MNLRWFENEAEKPQPERVHHLYKTHDQFVIQLESHHNEVKEPPSQSIDSLQEEEHLLVVNFESEVTPLLEKNDGSDEKVHGDEGLIPNLGLTIEAPTNVAPVEVLFSKHSDRLIGDDDTEKSLVEERRVNNVDSFMAVAFKGTVPSSLPKLYPPPEPPDWSATIRIKENPTLVSRKHSPIVSSAYTARRSSGISISHRQIIIAPPQSHLSPSYLYCSESLRCFDPGGLMPFSLLLLHPLSLDLATIQHHICFCSTMIIALHMFDELPEQEVACDIKFLGIKPIDFTVTHGIKACPMFLDVKEIGIYHVGCFGIATKIDQHWKLKTKCPCCSQFLHTQRRAQICSIEEQEMGKALLTTVFISGISGIPISSLLAFLNQNTGNFEVVLEVYDTAFDNKPYQCRHHSYDLSNVRSLVVIAVAIPFVLVFKLPTFIMLTLVRMVVFIKLDGWSQAYIENIIFVLMKHGHFYKLKSTVLEIVLACSWLNALSQYDILAWKLCTMPIIVSFHSLTKGSLLTSQHTELGVKDLDPWHDLVIVFLLKTRQVMGTLDCDHLFLPMLHSSVCILSCGFENWVGCEKSVELINKFHRILQGLNSFWPSLTESKLTWSQLSTIWFTWDILKLQYVALNTHNTAQAYSKATIDAIKIFKQDAIGNSEYNEVVLGLLDHYNHSGPIGQHLFMVFELPDDKLFTFIREADCRELKLALFSDNSCCWLLENQGMIASDVIPNGKHIVQVSYIQIQAIHYHGLDFGKILNVDINAYHCKSWSFGRKFGVGTVTDIEARDEYLASIFDCKNVGHNLCIFTSKLIELGMHLIVLDCHKHSFIELNIIEIGSVGKAAYQGVKDLSATSYYKATLGVTTGLSAPYNGFTIIYKQQGNELFQFQNHEVDFPLGITFECQNCCVVAICHRKMIYTGSVLALRTLLKWKTLPLKHGTCEYSSLRTRTF